jgi:hypothetical protein
MRSVFISMLLSVMLIGGDFDIGDWVDDASDFIDGIGSVDDILDGTLLSSLASIEFECDIEGMSGLKIDMCSYVDKFDSTFGFDLSVGPCRVKGSLDKECVKKWLSDLCKAGPTSFFAGYEADSTSKGDGWEANSYVVSPKNNSFTSAEEVNVVSTDILVKGAYGDEDCDAGSKAIKDGKVKYGDVAVNDIYKNTTLGDVKNFGTFSRGVEMLRDCMKMAATNGKNVEEAKEMCDSWSFYSLPENRAKMEQEISDAAMGVLGSPLAGSYEAQAGLEAELRSKFLKECEGAMNVETCEQGVMSGDDHFNVNKVRDATIADIEMSRAVALKTSKEATQSQFMIVHQDAKSIAKLPKSLQLDYIALNDKQVSFETLYKHFAREESAILTQLASLNAVKVKTASKPYYYHLGFAKLQAILQEGIK